MAEREELLKQLALLEGVGVTLKLAGVTLKLAGVTLKLAADSTGTLFYYKRHESYIEVFEQEGIIVVCPGIADAYLAYSYDPVDAETDVPFDPESGEGVPVLCMMDSPVGFLTRVTLSNGKRFVFLSRIPDCSEDISAVSAVTAKALQNPGCKIRLSDVCTALNELVDSLKESKKKQAEDGKGSNAGNNDRSSFISDIAFTFVLRQACESLGISDERAIFLGNVRMLLKTAKQNELSIDEFIDELDEESIEEFRAAIVLGSGLGSVTNMVGYDAQPALFDQFIKDQIFREVAVAEYTDEVLPEIERIQKESGKLLGEGPVIKKLRT